MPIARSAMAFGKAAYSVPTPPSGSSYWSGATINAADATEATVQAAINSASPLDVVVVPAGTATWTNLALNKGVLLKSNGGTTITLGAGNTITKQTSHRVGMRGITFTKTGGGNASYGFTINGAWLDAKPVIIENCTFTIRDSALFRVAVAGGVLFGKCSFDALLDDSIIKPQSFDKTGDKAKSSTSWSTVHSIGTSDTIGERNIYVEDCYFHGGGNQGMDCDNATRVVFRYNRADFFSLNSHGLDTSEIGVRHVEVYNNQFRHSSTGEDLTQPLANVNKAIWVRGGVWAITDNTFDDYAGGFWGDKPEVACDIRSQQDNSGLAYGDFTDGRAYMSSGNGTYPRQHQISVNWDGRGTNSGYFVDPLYIWNNTGDGTSGGGALSFANGGGWGSHSPCFDSGRDYFNGGTERPSYTKYTYPHPMREVAGLAY